MKAPASPLNMAVSSAKCRARVETPAGTRSSKVTRSALGAGLSKAQRSERALSSNTRQATSAAATILLGSGRSGRSGRSALSSWAI